MRLRNAHAALRTHARLRARSELGFQEKHGPGPRLSVVDPVGREDVDDVRAGRARVQLASLSLILP